jgi:ribosome-binding factor A
LVSTALETSHYRRRARGLFGRHSHGSSIDAQSDARTYTRHLSFESHLQDLNKIMTNTRRVSRVAELIKREVSQMILFDIKDDRVGAGMVSVTAVDVAGDLQHTKIFVSIYGSEEVRAQTMEGLKSVTGYVRSELGKRVRLRRTPTVLFVEDTSFDRATSVLSLINQLSLKRGESEDLDAEDSEPTTESTKVTAPTTNESTESA